MEPSEQPATLEQFDAERSRAIQQMQRYAWFLDASIRVPFTQFRVGIDSLVGLIPGVGDVIGTVLSGGTLVHAWRLGVGPLTLLKMLWNVAIETVVGIVPILGDLFDMVFKANVRNAELALADLQRGTGKLTRAKPTRRSFYWLIGAIVGSVVLFAGIVAFVIWAVFALFG